MERKYTAPAVEKMLDLIEVLADSPGGRSINELARLTDSPVNSVYRICTVLRERGYLSAESETGLYVLGSRFYRIGQAAGRRISLHTAAAPVLGRLMRETGESTQLITLSGNAAVIRLQAETDQAIRIHAETCSVILPHCSAGGKCALAYLPEAELEAFLKAPHERLTEHTVTEAGALRRELAAIRADGYALDREEYMIGLRCVGAPVFAADGACAGGIDVMYPAYRVDAAAEAGFIPLVRRAAEDISRALGAAL